MIVFLQDFNYLLDIENESVYNISIINERGNNNMFGQPLPKVKLTPKFSLFLNDDKFVTFTSDTLAKCKAMAKKLGKPCTVYVNYGRNFAPIWSKKDWSI